MHHSTGSFEGAGGEELFEQRWVPEQTVRAVVAIVHGLGEHSGRYSTVVDALTPHGYAISSFDLRGHGRSAGARGHIRSWDEYRDDVRRFIRRVAAQTPTLPLFLYGHSMGGLIALDYALHHPDGLQGVVASAPALSNREYSPVLVALGRILSRIYPRFTIDLGFGDDVLSRDPGSPGAINDDELLHGRVSARLSTEIATTMVWTQSHASEWRLPLFVVHGDADRVIPIESSRQFFEHVPIADKTYRVVPGGYHEPHNDIEREDVLRDIASWLDRHVTAAPLLCRKDGTRA